MPRIWKKKTDRKRATPEEIKTAIHLVLHEGHETRAVARDIGIPKSTLHRHVQKAKLLKDVAEYNFIPNITVRQVFTKEQEDMLCSYLIKAGKMNYGLTPLQARRLAYEYASKLNLQFPEQWKTSKLAGREWWFGFRSRQKDLSLRKPESTSLSRSTAFNRTNVCEFFNNLKSLYEKYNFPPDSIFNLDETAVTTVHKPPKVISQRGLKQVGQVTSAERGQLVTMCNIISASGNSIPPAFVFPRVNFKEFMLNQAPIGSLGLAHQTGWMTAENFLLVIKHLIKHTKPSKEDPILVIMDNHETHITIDVVTEARKSGVHLLTMPPHCSHRLQPLDVGVYSPFKTHYNVAANNWMLNNPGKTLTIYNVAEIAGIAFNNAMSRKNILSGFQKTGIFPFNDEIFTDDDFLCSSVTDRPFSNPEPSTSVPLVEKPSTSVSSAEDPLTSVPRVEDSVPSTSSEVPSVATPNRSKDLILPQIISPEDIAPFPKAQPRKSQKGRGRERGRTLIITNTPEKDALLAKMLQREKKSVLKKEKCERKLKKKQSIKRKLIDYSSETSEEDVNMEFHEMSDELEEIEPEFNFSADNIEKNDFVLVKFELKKSVVHYVGQVDEVCKNDEFEVNFLRRQTNTFHFSYPENTDKCTVPGADILLHLPAPTYTGGTERAVANLKFTVDLSKFNSTLR